MIKHPRIIFAGTPEFAAVHLQALIDADYLPVAVYTQPDRRAGRGKKLSVSAVKQVALDYSLPVYQPQNFKSDETIEQLHQLKPDLLVVVAYGLLLPQAVLSIAKLGSINVHASLLPRWRGAAPIQRAIEAGDKQTGICLMQMELSLDTGPILARTKTLINNVTAVELHDSLAKDGAELLVKSLPFILTGKLQAKEQDNKYATYAHKLSKQEARINWNRSADELVRQIRAFNPWPVSYFQFKEKIIRVWQAEVDMNDQTNQQPGTLLDVSAKGLKVATAKGVIWLSWLQMPGKKSMPVEQFLSGQPDFFKVSEKLL